MLLVTACWCMLLLQCPAWHWVQSCLLLLCLPVCHLSAALASHVLSLHSLAFTGQGMWPSRMTL